jgi:hypothetical protein
MVRRVVRLAPLAGLLALAPTAGATLVYQRTSASFAPRTWVAKNDGSGAHRLALGQPYGLSYDGKLVAVQRLGETTKLRLVRTNGSGEIVTALHCGGAEATFSRDGKHAACLVDTTTENVSNLELIDTATGTAVTIGTARYDGPPSFSPDSTQMVVSQWASSDFAKRHDVYVIDVAAPHLATLLTAGGLYPLWGPNAIAFSKRRPAAHFAEGANIWLVKPNGTGLRQLTHVKPIPLLFGMVPQSWSASGGKLLAHLSGQDTDEAWIVNAATGKGHAIGTPVGETINTPRGIGKLGRAALLVRNFTSSHPSVARVDLRTGAIKVLAKNATTAFWSW